MLSLSAAKKRKETTKKIRSSRSVSSRFFFRYQGDGTWSGQFDLCMYEVETRSRLMNAIPIRIF